MSTSKITTAFEVDDPVALTASYQFDVAERRLIDDQIRGLEIHATRCLIGGMVCSWYRLDGASDAVDVGDCVASASMADGRKVTLATYAALVAAGGACGIVVSAAAPGSFVLVCVGGIFPASISQMASEAGPVRVGPGGAAERVSSLGVGDCPVGYADGSGNVTVIAATEFSDSGWWTRIRDFESIQLANTIGTLSDLRGLIEPGFPLRALDLEGTIFNDGGSQIGGLDGLTGINSRLLDWRGRLHVTVVNVVIPYGYRYINIYNHPDRAAEHRVGSTSLYHTTGVMTVDEDNGSGLGGTIEVLAVGSADADIFVEFYKWFLVSAIDATTITVAGPALSTSPGGIAELWFGNAARVVAISCAIPGDYATAAGSELLADLAHSPERWSLPPSRICRLRVWAGAQSGTAPIVNASVEGNPVCSSNSDDGLEIAAAETFYETTTDLHASACGLEYGNDVEVTTTAGAAGGGDTDLAVLVSVVYE